MTTDDSPALSLETLRRAVEDLRRLVEERGLAYPELPVLYSMPPEAYDYIGGVSWRKRLGLPMERRIFIGPAHLYPEGSG